MNMRLVSAVYDDIYPFNTSGLFDKFVASNSPMTLQAGDVLVVWGGGDIHPSLYGKALSKRSGAGSMPTARDQIEWAMMQRAKELGLPIVGICRGAQMLCALAGGYLMQHVTGHGGYHDVVTNEGKRYEVNSLHHQMMVVPEGVKHEVLAAIPDDELRSSEYWDENNVVDHQQEPEFVYFNDVKGFAVQWHPEMLSAGNPGTQHLFSEMERRLAN